MQALPIPFVPTGKLFALVGHPNCGKTALFNRLTGSQQKVGNYAGVTVERKEGLYRTHQGQRVRLLDLPGIYSLYPRSQDERLTCNVLNGSARGERKPDMVICVIDACNLRRSLRLALAIQRQGLPCLLVLNMMDEARARGLDINTEALGQQLGMPVVGTVAVQAHGAQALREQIDAIMQNPHALNRSTTTQVTPSITGVEQDHLRVQQILKHLGIDHQLPDIRSDEIDAVVLHPIIGPLLLLLLLFLIFQAIFQWATVPMALITQSTEWITSTLNTQLQGSVFAEGLLKSLLIDGVIAGAGSVLVFLPQILILFFFILLLEESGYLPRAAFLLDRTMGVVGLSGRAFIPLLSSFACAIPGITAARTIHNTRDRLVTILLAPLMTCSARLPVYTLLISAFIPEKILLGGLSRQGLVMLGLYVTAIVSAMLLAWLLKITTHAGRDVRPLLMELPTYRLPRLRSLAQGLWQRAMIFLQRVGGIVMVMTIGLWVLLSFPLPPAGATGADIEYSIAGTLGHGLAKILAPIGFHWQICIALIPGLAAREVAISALGTVYALSDGDPTANAALIPLIQQQWGMATGMAMLAWYVFAPQCLPTFAVMKRETGSWKMPCLAMVYLFLLAYGAAWLAYRVTRFATGATGFL